MAGTGSRPDYQWCLQTRSESWSKAPCTKQGKPGPKVAKGKRASQRPEIDHPVFQPNAAGIDIGAREIYVAIPADRDEHPVRECETFTGDLHQMAEWLVSCGITTVAMESTGVYWIPVCNVAYSTSQSQFPVSTFSPGNQLTSPESRS